MKKISETLRLGLIGAGLWGRNYIKTAPDDPGGTDVDDVGLGLNVVRAISSLEETLIPDQ